MATEFEDRLRTCQDIEILLTTESLRLFFWPGNVGPFDLRSHPEYTEQLKQDSENWRFMVEETVGLKGVRRWYRRIAHD